MPVHLRRCSPARETADASLGAGRSASRCGKWISFLGFTRELGSRRRAMASDGRSKRSGAPPPPRNTRAGGLSQEPLSAHALLQPGVPDCQGPARSVNSSSSPPLTASLDCEPRPGRRRRSTSIRELSTVESIDPVAPALRGRAERAPTTSAAPPRGLTTGSSSTRVRLFDFGGASRQDVPVDVRGACMRRRPVRVSRERYQAAGHVCAVASRSAEDVDMPSRIVGVRSVIGMPLLRTIRNGALSPEPVPDNLPRSEQVQVSVHSWPSWTAVSPAPSPPPVAGLSADASAGAPAPMGAVRVAWPRRSGPVAGSVSESPPPR